MKSIIVIAGLTALVGSSASAALVAAWDFQTTTNGGTAASASPNPASVARACDKNLRRDPDESGGTTHG